MARLDRSTRWPRRRWLAGSAAAVALVTGAATASTSPLSDPTSGRAVFTGVATAHATSLASNPGALSLGPSGAHLYVAATGTLEWMKVERQLLALDTGELSPGPTASGLVASPGATLAVWLARRAFTVGVEVLSPDPAHGTLRAEEALRYHTLGDQLRVTRLGTIGVSRRVLGRVYLGGSVSLIRPTLRLRYARDTALEAGRDSVRGLASDCGGAPCGVENPLAAERLALDAQPDALVTYDNAVWTAALQAELAPAWWLAVAYRLIPARTTLRGTGTLTTAPRDGAVDVRGDVLAYLTLPSAIDVELRGPLADPWELHVGGRWEDSSTLDAIDVRLLAADLRATGAPEWTRRARGLRDPLALWAGVEQADLGQRVLVGARLGVRSPEVARERTAPAAIAGWAGSLDLGLQVRLGGGLVAQLAYGVEVFPRVDVSVSAYNPADRLDCLDSGTDYDTVACANTRAGFAVPTAAGAYTRVSQAARLGIRYDLD
jgi:hypothetical protein